MPSHRAEVGLNHYLLIIEYDGSRYAGWQKQPGMITIQSELEKAAAVVLGKPVKSTAAGRTDKGVHARGQVVTLSAPANYPPKRFLLALNSLLPKDIAVTGVRKANAGSNARFDASGKVYRYYIWNKTYRSVWRKDRWHVARPLDLGLMKSAVQFIVGKHDFRAFEARGSTQCSKICNLERIKITNHGGEITLTFAADRFLYKMVRNITGTLVDVGLGRIAPDALIGILDGKNRRHAGRTAPSHGLFLEKIEGGKFGDLS